jgi:riboflavin synthase
MFTGIVEATGEVAAIESASDGTRMRIGAPFAAELSGGQSVSVDGACLTVEEHTDEVFEVFLASETLDRTTLGARVVGDPVNVERAMPADGRFDGHLVQGHVNATTAIRAVERVGEDWLYEFDLPAGQSRYVVEKGSIALDGISLTVAEVDAETFTVAIVPTTYEETTLSGKEAGDRVNVEIDVIAKYVEELVDR